ncbi:SRPBCC family protein, partial [Streptomyces capoamus]
MEWTGQVYADMPTVSAEMYVDAPPERLWGYVSDIHLMPELSAELQHVEWLDGATGPRAGSRFLGRSTHPALGNWQTISTVVDCEEPQRFAWAVGDPDHPMSMWRFTLHPQGTGTVLEQWAQLGPA